VKEKDEKDKSINQDQKTRKIKNHTREYINFFSIPNIS